MASKSVAVTSYNDIQVGDAAVAYDGATGNVIIQGEPLDGGLLLELARRVAKARQRDGFDEKPQSGRGFIGLHMDADQILAEQRDSAWRNLPLYYPESEREAITARIPQACRVLEGGG